MRPPEPRPAPRPIRPARVLLHPLWIGALVVLALNDQWLKYAGLLPPALTGKLSDFAGMLVAPALLAAMLGVQTRRGWWLAHLAVGSVFAALQLSPAFAAQWSALMGAFAFPWTVTSDPTDLVALPLLLGSARWFVAAMAVPSRRLARRSAEAGAAGVGLLCCMATSEETGEWLPDIEAEAWLHNGTGDELVVRVRQLRPSIQLDCVAVASDPAGLLPASLFDRAQSWTLPADANMAVLDTDVSGCRVAMIDSDAFAPVVVFWFADELPIQSIAGEGDGAGAGRIELSVDDDGRGRYEASDELVFAPREVREPSGACAMQDDAERVDWGDQVPIGTQRVQALVPGVDGCTAIDLVAVTAEQGERVYLCTPPLELPFAVGDTVDIRREYASSSESVVITRLGDDLQPTQPLAELWVSRGSEAPALPGLELSVVPIYGCEWASDPCGAAVRGVSVALGGSGYDAVQLELGVPATSSSGAGGDTWTVTLAHAQERAVLDDECSAGPVALGFDIEMVAVHDGARE